MLTLFLGTTKAVDESLFNSLSIYQVMVSSFQDGDSNVGYGIGYGPSHHSGDLRGIINSLDYIADLGFNALWMTPIFDSSNGQGGAILQSTGYFATNYFKVDPKFGTEDTLRELIEKAHNKGLYVLLDGVFGHHGGVYCASPNGNWPQGNSNPVSYPASLPYFQEVAQYWIREFGIDGWRLDQSYQMYQDGHNYLKEIREAVYQAADARKNAGQQWGTLGYIVAEDWNGVQDINTKAYGGDGVRSAFDFPYRYNLVQAIAQEESGAGGYGVDVLAKVHQTPSEKGYNGNVYPNLFITNHDVWRFGNLVRAKYGYGPGNNDYVNRHKMALGMLAAYTGPITVYYGDELGDITDCWWGTAPACGGNTYSDNCARTNGRISGFDQQEQDLHDFTKAIMKIRNENPAMWRGSYSKTIKDGIYCQCKYDTQTGNKIIFATNLGTSSNSINYNVGGHHIVDLVTGETINGGGTYSISMGGLQTRFFKVLNENEPSETPTPVTPTETPPTEVPTSSEIESSSVMPESPTIYTEPPTSSTESTSPPTESSSFETPITVSPESSTFHTEAIYSPPIAPSASAGEDASSSQDHGTASKKNSSSSTTVIAICVTIVIVAAIAGVSYFATKRYLAAHPPSNFEEFSASQQQLIDDHVSA